MAVPVDAAGGDNVVSRYNLYAHYRRGDMAAQGLSEALRVEIARRLAAGESVVSVARDMGLDRNTVAKYRGHKSGGVPPEVAARLAAAPSFVHPAEVPAFLPDPAPEAGGPALPEPVPLTHDPYRVDEAGHWLVLGDLHIPYHDTRTILSAVDEARRRAVTGVLINGDFVDGTQFGRHRKKPTIGRFKPAAEKGTQCLAWLRSQFPRARIIFKLGNHDEWLMWYLAEHAPEAFGLEGFDLESVLKVRDYGVEVVGDKRAVHLGRLPVFHGHEFRGSGGVNPARWLYLRIGTSGLVNHFHRSSLHNESSYDGRLHATWSLGCSCFLSPEYDPNTKWDHGYAFVTVAQGGHFEVSQRRLLRDGRVV